MAQRKKAPLPREVQHRADIGIETGRTRIRAQFERLARNHPQEQAEATTVAQPTADPTPEVIQGEVAPAPVAKRELTAVPQEVTPQRKHEPVAEQPAAEAEAKDVSASKESKTKASQWDKSKGAAKGAVSGAMKGRAAGPWGAAAGAVVGAAHGRFTAQPSERGEKADPSADRVYEQPSDPESIRRQQEHPFAAEHAAEAERQAEIRRKEQEHPFAAERAAEEARQAALREKEQQDPFANYDGGPVPMTGAAEQRMSAKAAAEQRLDQQLESRGLQRDVPDAQRGPEMG